MSAYVAKHLGNRQKGWNEAMQNRLAATTAAIEGIKSLKMMGMEDAIQSQIFHLRSNEIKMSKRLRWILVAYNTSGMYQVRLTNIIPLILTLYLSKCTWDPRSSLDYHPLPLILSKRSNACRSNLYISCPSSHGNTSSQHGHDSHSTGHLCYGKL